jgi:hypothetical protein
MKMSSKWSFLAAWIAFLTISVCSSAFADAPSPGSLDAAWTDYLSKLDSSSIQPNCFPKRVSPPSGTATQGTVILIHGYTACPQQFFAWADELAGRGYEVLMPLLESR